MLVVPKSEITLGNVRFYGENTGINSVTVKQSVENIGATATVVIPRNFPRKDGKGILDCIRVGDTATVRLGYNDNIETEFTGYISGISDTTPVTIELEDEWWQFKKKRLTKSWQTTTLDQLLSFVFGGYRIDCRVSCDLTGGFVISNATAYEVAKKLRESYGFTLHLDPVKKTVLAYYPYNFEGFGTHTYVFGTKDCTLIDELRQKQLAPNIVKNDLKFTRKDDMHLRITCPYTDRKGKHHKFDVGDTAHSDADHRTLNLGPNITDEQVAAAIWTLERLFDTHTAEITDYIATMKPHSLRWYVEKAKAFMYGVPLIDGTDQHDTTGMTDEQMAAAKIVTFSACTEANATLYLKVAKAGPAPLTADEKTAFVAYMHEIKDAGVRIDVISENGDYLKLDMVIYYDPLLINADGESKATGSKVVEDAIKNYIENIPFNGEFRKNELEDAIQAVEGVVMVEFERAEHSETGAYGTYEEVIPYCKPTSGYFKFDSRKALSEFTTLKPIATIMAELDEAKQHFMPKGSVIAWSGICDCDHVPYGFVPCGGFFGGNASQFAPNGAGEIEILKWRGRYENISINSYGINNGALVGIKVSSCNGVTIPDLTDRFIVQAGMSYSAGDTGGVNNVTLTAEQSGMPAHHHTLNVYSHISNPGVTSEQRWVPDTEYKTFGGYDTLELEKRNASQSHENRPPFYALCYLIKVI